MRLEEADEVESETLQIAFHVSGPSSHVLLCVLTFARTLVLGSFVPQRTDIIIRAGGYNVMDMSWSKGLCKMKLSIRRVHDNCCHRYPKGRAPSQPRVWFKL